MIALALALAIGQDAIDCADAHDQPAWTLCAAEAAGHADETLNTLWKRVLTAARAMDAKVAADDRDDTSYVAQIRSAQRAWLAYRDAECSAERYDPPGGTGDSYVEFKCVERMSRARISELEKLLKGW